MISGGESQTGKKFQITCINRGNIHIHSVVTADLQHLISLVMDYNIRKIKCTKQNENHFLVTININISLKNNVIQNEDYLQNR